MKFDNISVDVIEENDKYDVWSACATFNLGEIRKTLDGYRFYPEQFQNLESGEMKEISQFMEQITKDSHYDT